MRLEALERFPARPESEFEWEDLLVRIELMARAVRVALDPLDSDDPAVRSLLRELSGREAEVSRFLEAAAGLEPTPPAPARADGDLQEFVRLRQRNFAMVQRRGIEVWDWSAELSPGGHASVYRILAALARADVEALERLRETRRVGPAC